MGIPAHQYHHQDLHEVTRCTSNRSTSPNPIIYFSDSAHLPILRTRVPDMHAPLCGAYRREGGVSPVNTLSNTTLAKRYFAALVEQPGESIFFCFSSTRLPDECRWRQALSGPSRARSEHNRRPTDQLLESPQLATATLLESSH